MGDAADDILDGLVCEVCGEVIDEEAPGYARQCRSCSGGEDDDADD